MSKKKVKFELRIIIEGEADPENIDALIRDLKSNPLLKDVKIDMTTKNDDYQTWSHTRRQ